MPQFRPMLPCSAQMARQKPLRWTKPWTIRPGRLVSVNVSEGSVTIKTLTEKHTSGKVNSTATKLGDLSFADNVEILDTSSEGTAAAVDASRLSG